MHSEVDFKELKYVMKEAVLNGEGVITQFAICTVCLFKTL